MVPGGCPGNITSWLPAPAPANLMPRSHFTSCNSAWKNPPLWRELGRDLTPGLPTTAGTSYKARFHRTEQARTEEACREIPAPRQQPQPGQH